MEDKTVSCIKRFIDIYGDCYDFSEFVYVDSKTHGVVICHKHGRFNQIPNSLLQGKGCRLCGIERRTKNRILSNEEYVKKCSLLYGDLYDLSEVLYKGRYSKVVIGCKKHGFFETTACNFTQGHGCKKCGYESSIKTNNYFIEKSISVHGDRYDYSKVNYISARKRVTIICKEHGEFTKIPFEHYHGKGCPKCLTEWYKNFSPKTTEYFIEKSKLIHGDRYDYKLSEYITWKTPLKIICKKHGIFEQIPNNHVRGKGCPKCNYNVSSLEIELHDFIKSLNFKILTNKRNIIKPYELDIFIPELNKAIEFNGVYWHYHKDNFILGKHALKSNLCREQGIKLLHIREDLWKTKRRKMENVIIKFLNGKGN